MSAFPSLPLLPSLLPPPRPLSRSCSKPVVSRPNRRPSAAKSGGTPRSPPVSLPSTRYCAADSRADRCPRCTAPPPRAAPACCSPSWPGPRGQARSARGSTPATVDPATAAAASTSLSRSWLRGKSPHLVESRRPRHLLSSGLFTVLVFDFAGLPDRELRRLPRPPDPPGARRLSHLVRPRPARRRPRVAQSPRGLLALRPEGPRAQGTGAGRLLTASRPSPRRPYARRHASFALRTT